MLIPFLAIVIGIIILIWSADKFVEGAAVVAERLGMSQLLVGMLIVGFGTSLPEMMVSALSAWQGAPNLALGNAYGSNIANIFLILGVTALVNPIPVNQIIVRREIPMLIVVTGLAISQVWYNLHISRLDAVGLLFVFAVSMYISIKNQKQTPPMVDTVPAAETEKTESGPPMSTKMALVWVVVGLTALMASSRALVWGAVEISLALGISELVIGLTVVAIGTSLPELASSLAAARKNRHDIAIGNVVGSNMFNTLVVVGIAGMVHPIRVDPIILHRDLAVVAVATLILFAVCVSIKGRPSKISRLEGLLLLSGFIVYTAHLVATSIPS